MVLKSFESTVLWAKVKDHIHSHCFQSHSSWVKDGQCEVTKWMRCSWEPWQPWNAINKYMNVANNLIKSPERVKHDSGDVSDTFKCWNLNCTMCLGLKMGNNKKIAQCNSLEKTAGQQQGFKFWLGVLDSTSWAKSFSHGITKWHIMSQYVNICHVLPWFPDCSTALPVAKPSSIQNFLNPAQKECQLWGVRLQLSYTVMVQNAETLHSHAMPCTTFFFTTAWLSSIPAYPCNCKVTSSPSQQWSTAVDRCIVYRCL